METTNILERTAGALAATTVFAPPYERDGLTVIPAVSVRGGGGGGSGSGDDGESGEGGGFGVNARPAGAIVIDGHTVRWQRAPIDPTRIIVGAQLVAIAYFVFAWLTARARASG